MSGQTYEISVITPFHNVDLKYFRAAAQSMFDQTIGFDKIQWIIVLHNCEAQYRPALEKMFESHPNVRLVELCDGARTPSAPRNYGMQFATAPYVGYLDGDDSYKANCLEECVRNARETNAQVVCFRRDYELEDETLGSLTEIVLWNQLKKRIVIDRGNWEGMQKIFDGLFSFVTSKVFDREFLLAKKIAFDIEIPYCEDSIYSMCALAQAEHVCVLPQLIGYHYYINGASLVQSNRKPSATILAYARGLAKIFHRGYDFGIDINYFAQRLILHICRFMMHSDVTPEDREEIKRALAPIIYRTTPVRPSKLVTREWANFAFTMCREVILNTSAYEGNKALIELASGLVALQKILGNNERSDFGQEYQFSSIQTIAAYQFHVPLSRLASYRKLIDLQVNIGEHGILTSDTITGYLRDGAYIVPITAASQRPFLKALAKILKGHHNLWVARCDLSGRMQNDNTRVTSLGSMLVRGYFFEYVYGGGGRPATFSTPDGAFFSTATKDQDYRLVLKCALLDRDIDQIVALHAGRIARLLRLLETERISVLDEVRAVNPARADEISAALADFDGGIGEPFARRLWPKLRKIVACGTGQYAADRDYVRRFTGDIVWNNGTVMIPEMVLGHAVEDDSDQYVFDGTDCFTEFFQNDSDDISKPKVRSDLEPGHTYNVIVTNGAGLYRVVTDSEIRVVRNDVEGLVVEITQ